MNEIKKEMDWYPYIIYFLQQTGKKVLQNEVEFFEQLKILDLFAWDNNYYYVIEVKKYI